MKDERVEGRKGVMLVVSDHVGEMGLNGVTLTQLSWDACNDDDSHAV